MKMFPYMKYSFIIPIYNPLDLNSLIESLENLKYNPKITEYIFIDDGSIQSDHHRIRIEASKLMHKKYIFLWGKNGKNRVCQARNLGAYEATWEILIFIDQDTLIHENYLNMADIYSIEEKIILWGYYGYNTSRKELTSDVVQEFLSTGNIHQTIFQDFRRWHNGLKIHQDTLWTVFCWSHILFPKNMYETVGGYDESILRWGDEDVELWYRCHLSWYPMQFIPSLSVLNTSKKLYTPPYRLIEIHHIPDIIENWIQNLQKHRSREYAEYIYWRLEDLKNNSYLPDNSASILCLENEIKQYSSLPL